MRCRRDTKSVSWKALMGEIQRFTGISDPYDAFSSDVNLRSDREQTSGIWDALANGLGFK
jgi:adenylylsulfate kinase-like enzyme